MKLVEAYSHFSWALKVSALNSGHIYSTINDQPTNYLNDFKWTVKIVHRLTEIFM